MAPPATWKLMIKTPGRRPMLVSPVRKCEASSILPSIQVMGFWKKTEVTVQQLNCQGLGEGMVALMLLSAPWQANAAAARFCV